MGKRRITLVVDDDLRLAKGNRWPYDNLLRADSDYGVTVESVEDLPEPCRVQFTVLAEHAPSWERTISAEVLRVALERHWLERVKFTVTEVEVTS